MHLAIYGTKYDFSLKGNIENRIHACWDKKKTQAFLDMEWISHLLFLPLVIFLRIKQSFSLFVLSRHCTIIIYKSIPWLVIVTQTIFIQNIFSDDEKFQWTHLLTKTNCRIDQWTDIDSAPYFNATFRRVNQTADIIAFYQRIEATCNTCNVACFYS